MKSIYLNAKSFVIILNLVILITSFSFSQIIYHDVVPDHTVHLKQVKGIDLNNDGINDFNLLVTEEIMMSEGTPITHVTNTCTIQGIGAQSAIAANNGVKVFSLGENIESSNWSNTSTLSQQYLEYFEGNPDPVIEEISGNFTGPNSSGKFLGLKFYIDGIMHYAYLGINVHSNTIVIRDYAYNSFVGEAIQAGKTITSLSNYLTSHTNIKVIDNSLVVDFDHNFSGNIDLINMQGGIVKSLSIQGKKAEVTLDSLPIGVYQVVVSGNGGYVVKKIFISSDEQLK